MAWSGAYKGVVVSTADPTKRGFVRLKVAQVSGTATTGWVPPLQAGGSTPSVGQTVWVLYESGNASHPAYLPPIPSSAKTGVATLVAGVATIASTAVTAKSRIFAFSQADGGTPGWLRCSAKVVGTSFDVKSSSTTDTSTFAWMIVDPA